MPRDKPEARFPDARPHPVEKRQLPDGRVHDLVGDELLDLVQHGLAPLAIRLGGLFLEQPVDVRIAAVDISPARDHESVEARGGIAEGAAGGLDEVS